MHMEIRRISGLVAEYIVAIDVTRVRFPADAIMRLPAKGSARAADEDDTNPAARRRKRAAPTAGTVPIS